MLYEQKRHQSWTLQIATSPTPFCQEIGSSTEAGTICILIYIYIQCIYTMWIMWQCRLVLLERNCETDTLQGINISHPKTLLKMIFLFQRWDVLFSWRVIVVYLIYIQFIPNGIGMAWSSQKATGPRFSLTFWSAMKPAWGQPTSCQFIFRQKFPFLGTRGTRTYIHHHYLSTWRTIKVNHSWIGRYIYVQSSHGSYGFGYPVPFFLNSLGGSRSFGSSSIGSLSRWKPKPWKPWNERFHKNYSPGKAKCPLKLNSCFRCISWNN